MHELLLGPYLINDPELYHDYQKINDIEEDQQPFFRAVQKCNEKVNQFDDSNTLIHRIWVSVIVGAILSMEVDALLNIAQAAVWRLEVRVSLKRVSKYELEDYFQVRADDCVAENAKKRNALSTSVLSVICRNQVAELLVYFLELFLRDLRSR